MEGNNCEKGGKKMGVSALSDHPLLPRERDAGFATAGPPIQISDSIRKINSREQERRIKADSS